ncbi:hypothetical protein FRB96_001851 [Tulasnella sp. 330]|nr:hypothetical protein FRB96_001851 [Tulasnella sp. 330]
MQPRSRSWVDRLNARVADSLIGRHFRLDGSGHLKTRADAKFTTELRAGLTTFAAMSYIISVNAIVLADTGGTCVCKAGSSDPFCLNDADYAACKLEVQRDLVTATSAASALASTLMGLLANLPVGLAPGMGLNAYFAYSVVGVNGSGALGITYRQALGAVFLEGWIFFLLSLLGVRQWLARIIPRSLTLATGAGIGLFVAFIGLSPSSGLGVIGGDYTNLVGLGGCPSQYSDPLHPTVCLSHVLQSPTTWLGIFLGGFLTVLLMLYRVRGAIILGIILVSLISWPRDTPVTYFPHTPSGDSDFAFFSKIVDFRRLKYTGAANDFDYRDGKVWFALVTFLYVDLLDTTGTLYSMAKFSGVLDPVTLDFENSTIAYMVDAFSISMGSLMGTSPVTAYIESATGIAEGGKTGLTAITAGLCFAVSLFFAPVFASIPSWATGGALVIAGSLMMQNAAGINWGYLGDAIPAFLTIIIIPLSYNIAYGLIAGILSMFILKVIPNLVFQMSGGGIEPDNYDYSEEWIVPPGGFIPLWMRRAARREPYFWREPETAGDITFVPGHDGNESYNGPYPGEEEENEHPMTESYINDSSSTTKMDMKMSVKGEITVNTANTSPGATSSVVPPEVTEAEMRGWRASWATQ